MKPQQLRRLRLALIAGLLLVSLAVLLTLRRPGAPPAALPQLEPGGANTSRTGDLEYRMFRDGRESLRLKAQRMEGSEKEELRFTGVELHFPYMAQGQPGQGTIQADECRYTPALQRAQFRGHVVVRTADGFELLTSSLSFRGDRGVARGDDPLTFSRKDLSGSATGFVYHAEEGTLELRADVHVRVADPDQPAADVRSARAVVEKAKGSAEFMDGVVVQQGPDTLKAHTYYMEFVRETRVLRRAHAYGDVELTLRGPGQAAGGIALPTAGPRVLRTTKLDLWFHPNRALAEAAAGPEAELRLLPGPRERQGPRRLRARILIFRFDTQGRLAEVQGQKDAQFLSEPPPGSNAPPLEASCRAFLAQLDAPSGALRSVDFQRDVLMTRGTQQASAARARHDEVQGLLRLLRKGELRDNERHTRLTAETIDLGTRNGSVAARGDVRQSEEGGANGSGGLLGGGRSQALAVARSFDYDPATRASRYEGEALLRAGDDEVRAERLTIVETAAGQRVLTAEGGVVSRLHPATPAGPSAGERAPAPGAVEARAKVMVYDQAQGKIAYRQDVVLQQERLTTRSPRADLTLARDGRGLERLVAGEPVELTEGQRRVQGLRATYTPADRKIVVEGEQVILTGPGQEVRGRTLTFHMGDDRIVVDGREEARTETVFRKEPRKP